MDARVAHNPHHDSQWRYNDILRNSYQGLWIQFQRERSVKYAIGYREHCGDHGVYVRNFQRLLEMVGYRFVATADSTRILLDVFPSIGKPSRVLGWYLPCQYGRLPEALN